MTEALAEIRARASLLFEGTPTRSQQREARLAARHHRPTVQTLQKCNFCEISRQRFGVTSLSARRKNDSLLLSEDYE